MYVAHRQHKEFKLGHIMVDIAKISTSNFLQPSKQSGFLFQMIAIYFGSSCLKMNDYIYLLSFLKVTHLLTVP